MSFEVMYYNNRGDNMISDTIKELREKNDYTQTALAKKLGLSRSAINAWEMGVSVPSTSYLMELAKLFNVSTDYILGLDTKEKIDITFTYDLNGILNVSAEILSTGDEISKIMSTKGLSKEEIQDLKEVVSSNENNNELVPWKSANLFKLVEPNFRLAERKIPMLPSADREKLQEIMSDMKDAIVDNDKMALMKLDEELTDFLFDFVN